MVRSVRSGFMGFSGFTKASNIHARKPAWLEQVIQWNSEEHFTRRPRP